MAEAIVQPVTVFKELYKQLVRNTRSALKTAPLTGGKAD